MGGIFSFSSNCVQVIYHGWTGMQAWCGGIKTVHDAEQNNVFLPEQSLFRLEKVFSLCYSMEHLPEQTIMKHLFTHS